MRAQHVDKLLKKKQKIVEEMTAWLAKTKPTGTPASKYYPRKACKCHDAQHYIELLSKLKTPA